MEQNALLHLQLKSQFFHLQHSHMLRFKFIDDNNWFDTFSSKNWQGLEHKTEQRDLLQRFKDLFISGFFKSWTLLEDSHMINMKILTLLICEKRAAG